MDICLVGPQGEEVPARIFESCTYFLHPTFEHPKRRFTVPPFRLDEQGWGEFDFKIVAKFIQNGGRATINHELSFSESAVAVDFTIMVPYHIDELRKVLLESGPVPDYSIEDRDDHPVRQKIPQMATAIAAANEEIVGEVVKTIVAYPGVSDALLKRRHRTEEFVIQLGQLPSSVLEILFNILQGQY